MANESPSFLMFIFHLNENVRISLNLIVCHVAHWLSVLYQQQAIKDAKLFSEKYIFNIFSHYGLDKKANSAPGLLMNLNLDAVLI